VLVPVEEYAADPILLPPALEAPVDVVDYSSPMIDTMPIMDGPVYTVQKGDTLSSIASMYGTSWKKLAEYNALSNPNKLLVGQEIRIPGGRSATVAPVSRPTAPVVSAKSTTSAKPTASAKAPIKQGASYVIQRGDTLSGIASRAGLTVNEIKAANALDSNRIVAGKSLSIPKKGEVSVSAYSAAPSRTSVAKAPKPAPVAELAPIAEDVAPAPLAAPPAAAPSASAPVYEHVLYPGETLEDVARQYGSSQDEIMLLNGITSPDAVKPGTKLLVPIPE
jgi:LysM repeat protein